MRRGIFTIFVCVALFAAAQSAPPPRPRQTIGLALEGGGALGLAHIGVLQWMEEHHIPIDYVAGTSMGGLVGGIYATGMNPNEVRELVGGINWDGVIRGQTDFRDLSFRRKEDRTDYPAAFEFGLRHGVAFPGGFNSGHKVGLILDRIALPYSLLKSFDDLPTPFRCVSTELTEREEYVFKDGPLSEALRATMSIPGFFTPVRLNHKIYVDGGLLDNLPTDVVKEMGADRIIAVHLQGAKLNAETPLSSFSVLGESIAAVVATTERRGMQKADTVLSVDLARFGPTSFDEVNDLIAAGYAAAEANAAALLPYRLSDADWSEFQARRQSRRIPTVPTPQFVLVDGTSPAVAAQLEHKLKSWNGKRIVPRRLDQQLTELTGLGRFSAVGYNMVEKDGKVGLRIHAAEKEYAPPTVNPTLIIDGSDYQNVLFAVGARFTFLDIGRTNAELRTDVLAGSEYRAAVEYYLPLSADYGWFVAPRAVADNSPLNIYLRDKRLAEYRQRTANTGLDFGYTFNRFNELRFGYEFGWLQYDPDLGDKTLLRAVSGKQSLSRVRYQLNHLDDAIVPRSGVAVNANFSFYDSRPGATDQFPEVNTRIQYFQPVRPKDSIFFSGSGGTTFGYSGTGVPMFTLGGPFRLSAYGNNEIFTNQYFLLQAGYLHQVTQLPPILGNHVYLAGSYEIGKAYGIARSQRLPMDGTLGLVIQTLFGPAYIGGSYGDSGHHKFFFQLGRIF
jgi:NTE family protein